MDRSIAILIPAVWLCLGIGFNASAVSPESGQEARQEQVPDKSEKKLDVEKTLENAMKKMQASGEKKINVFVGEEQNIVQPGDYVMVKYVALSEDGNPVRLVGDGIQPLSGALESVSETDDYGALLLAGDKVSQMGLGGEIVKLKIGQNKKVILEPAQAFGEHQKSKVRSFPRIRRLPQRVELKPSYYYKKFKAFPVLNQAVDFNPYVEAKVVDITPDKATLVLQAEDGKVFPEEFGETVVKVDKVSQDIILTLNPTKGGRMGKGIVMEVEAQKFAVDYNHPLAGKQIEVDLTVVRFVKPSNFANEKIAWSKDYQEGLRTAENQRKPMLLFLYADWCQWCEKMTGGTFEDPWIRFFNDQYVWVRVNSDKETAYKAEFGQTGFPMTVLLSPEGRVIKKLKGYKKPGPMRQALLEMLNAYGDMDVMIANNSRDTRINVSIQNDGHL
jgi:FKBP-type peptidyl-prolyl cis-trans isomerase 2